MDLSSLELLQLDDNKIRRIERHAFMNMDLLKRLDLRGNKLTVISDEAFQNLPQLELLDLAYNQLRSLDFSMLDQVSHSTIAFQNVQCEDQLGLWLLTYQPNILKVEKDGEEDRLTMLSQLYMLYSHHMGE
jgi:Leucine-rich repeat (LRR) protein